MTDSKEQGESRTGAEQTAGNPTHPSDTWPPIGAESELAGSTSGIDYPATREDLEETAREQGASEEVLRRIGDMEERLYQSAGDAADAYQKAGPPPAQREGWKGPGVG